MSRFTGDAAEFLRSWEPLPRELIEDLRDSYAPKLITRFCELWGTTEAEVNWQGHAIQIDPDDPSVSLDGNNVQGEYVALSLTADGLHLRVTEGFDSQSFSVPAHQLGDVVRFENWTEHLHFS